ncbi:MAG TPA: regulatory protein RecX [Candidatus Limnocylindrales bacterium]|nr:regulatory protein RecX [Candidatus Limnocylindrales bacterium]
MAEVMDAAARFLEARPRSEGEVRRKLTTMGYRAALVDDVVGRLLILGYLDDEAFARAWVESRDRARPRGEHALRRELAQKGVDRVLVDGILGDRREEARGAAAAGTDGERVSPDDAAAERLLRKKLPALLREADPRKRRGRAYALLARSGFGPDVCSAVSRRVLDEAADGVADEDEDVPEGLTEV